MINFVSIIFWILLISYSSLSQDNDDYFAINLNYNYFFNSADFKELPGIPSCCPRFDYGYDYNLGISLFYRKFISDNWNIQYDIRYFNLSSKFESKETETFGTNNGFIQGEFTHFLNAEIDLLSINPSIAYNFKNINFNFGFALSYYLNKRYNQKEQITQPIDRGTFIDSLGNDSGSRIRNSNSGNLKSSRDFGLSVIPRISYKLALNNQNSIYLEPTISAEFNMLELSKEMNWYSFNISAGLSLVFQLDNFNDKNFELLPIDSIQPLPIDSLEFTDKRELQIKNDFDRAFNPVYLNTLDTLVNSIKQDNDKQYKKGTTLIEYDTIVIKKRLTIRKTKLRYDTIAVDNNSEFLNVFVNNEQDSSINKIEIDELIINNEYPILNKIYYDKNQVSISENFNKNSIRELPYYNFLDTLSKRYLIKKNKIVLHLIESDGNSASDTLRLNLLKKYLNEEKSIDYDDIDLKIEPNKNNSKITIVEIESKDLQLPMQISEPIKTSRLPKINILINHNIKSKIDNFKLIIKADSSTIMFQDYKYIPNSIEIEMDELIQDIESKTNYIKIELIAYLKNQQISSTQIIKVDYNSIEKNLILNERIEKYNKRTIINFDYNSRELSQPNIELLKLINQQIKGNNRVEIIGYTDDIGNLEYNKSLSIQRANEVGKYITNGKIYLKGAGINKKYQNMSSIESKIYSRCVEILIFDN